jgi:hypothetical protein
MLWIFREIRKHPSTEIRPRSIHHAAQSLVVGFLCLWWYQSVYKKRLEVEILSRSKKLVNFRCLEVSGMKWQKFFGVVVTDIPSTQSKSQITWSVSLFWALDNDSTCSFAKISGLDSSKNKYWIKSREITTLTDLSRITSCTKRDNVSYWLQLPLLLSKVTIKMQSSSSNASFDSTNGHKHLSLAVFFVTGFCHTFFTSAVMYKYFLLLFFFYLPPPNISRSLCVRSSLSYCPFILLFASVILTLWSQTNCHQRQCLYTCDDADITFTSSE